MQTAPAVNTVPTSKSFVKRFLVTNDYGVLQFLLHKGKGGLVFPEPSPPEVCGCRSGRPRSLWSLQGPQRGAWLSPAAASQRRQEERKIGRAINSVSPPLAGPFPLLTAALWSQRPRSAGPSPPGCCAAALPLDFEPAGGWWNRFPLCAPPGIASILGGGSSR